MIESTLICFFVISQPDIDTGEPVINNEVQLICVKSDDETITDIPDTNEQRAEDIEPVYEEYVTTETT